MTNRKRLAALPLLLCLCAGCAEKADRADSVYPVETDTKLTYWMPNNSVLSATAESLGDTAFADALRERTGIEVEYIQPNGDNNPDAFRIMIASQDLPDIIEYDWQSYPGGESKAVSEGYIIALDKLIEEYAPNFARLLRENKDIEEAIVRKSGGLNSFPFLRTDDRLLVTRGLVIRSDWLEKLGMDMPETIDEWTEVLLAFKEKMGADTPLCFAGELKGFQGAYQEYDGFYVKDGKITNSMLQPEYKEYLMKMHEWYELGLIPKNFPNLDSYAVEENMLTGKSGVCFAYAGSNMGKWLESADTEEGFDLAGTRFPVLEKGDVPELLYKDEPVSGLGAAITTVCTEPKLAAQLLDYGYSDEGHMLYNFGIEGESYTMDGDYPRFTDRIMNPREGEYFGSTLAYYARSPYSGPFLQDARYLEQYYKHPQQNAAVSAWSDGVRTQTGVPDLKLSTEEYGEIEVLQTRVQESATEMYYKMIMGAASFDEYDDYIASVRSSGLDEILELMNKAYAGR